jgi:hypothetical protein
MWEQLAPAVAADRHQGAIRWKTGAQPELLQGAVGVAGELLQHASYAPAGGAALRQTGQERRLAATVLLAHLRKFTQ